MMVTDSDLKMTDAIHVFVRTYSYDENAGSGSMRWTPSGPHTRKERKQ